MTTLSQKTDFAENPPMEHAEKQHVIIPWIISSTGLLGLAIAFFTDTWTIAISMGGVSVVSFFILRSLMYHKESFRFITSAIMAILGIMVIYQAQSYQFLYLIIFILLSSLVLFKDWKVYIPFLVIIILFLTIIYFFFSKPAEGQEVVTGEWILIYVGLLILNAVICSFLAENMRSITEQKNQLSVQLTQLQDYEETNIEFAKQISSGNFDVTYNLKENDVLGESLIEMSKNLKKAAIEERQRNWSVEGIAKIADILRVNHENLVDLAYNVISHLVKYTKANQGGIFIINDEDKQDVFLELKGCYAFDRRKYVEKKILVGQGLVGQAYLEKEIIYMTDVPDDYIHITSGLGDATPSSIIIVPIKMENQVIGILELASFHEFQPHERMFLEKVSENIASAIISSKVKDQTDRLLKDSQQMTEQMRAQEEEMRQNMEELQATQESLQRESHEKESIQREIVKTRDFLQAIINAIPDPVFVKDRQHRMMIVNDAVCKLNNWERKDVIGKTDFDFFPPEEAQKMWDSEEELFETRHSVEVVMKATRNGKTTYVVDKKRIVEGDDGELFLVGTNNDVTDMKNIEEQLAKEKYLLDALMTNATDSIYFKDNASKFIRISDNMLSVFKVKSQEEIAGKSDFDFFTEEHARPAFESEQEIMRTRKPLLNLIEKETWDDGRVSYVSTSKMPLLDLSGNVVGTFGISRDITDSKMAELEMQKQQKRTESLFNYISETIIVTDEQLAFKFLSDKLLVQINYKLEEILESSLYDLVHVDDNKALAKLIKEARSGKEPQGKIRLRSKTGDYLKLDISVVDALADEAIQGFILKVKTS
jgi:PAS domain S-box-containing protein